jgi:hypothetical protein
MMTAFTPVLPDMNSEVTRSAPSKKWMQSKVWTAAVKRTLTFIIHKLTIVARVHVLEVGLFHFESPWANPFFYFFLLFFNCTTQNASNYRCNVNRTTKKFRVKNWITPKIKG